MRPKAIFKWETWENWSVRLHNVRTAIELRSTTWRDHAYERRFVFRLGVRVPTIYAFIVPTTDFYVHLAWVLSAHFSDDRVRSIVAVLGGTVDRNGYGNWWYDDIPF